MDRDNERLFRVLCFMKNIAELFFDNKPDEFKLNELAYDISLLKAKPK